LQIDFLKKAEFFAPQIVIFAAFFVTIEKSLPGGEGGISEGNDG